MDDLQEQVRKLEEKVEFLMLKRMTQVDYVPGSIKQRHIEANIIFFGLEADLPDGSTGTKAYFCTDSFKLKLWTGALWKSATLS
jgi:hypothetical protein